MPKEITLIIEDSVITDLETTLAMKSMTGGMLSHNKTDEFTRLILSAIHKKKKVINISCNKK